MGYFEIRRSKKGLFHWVEIEDDQTVNVETDRHQKLKEALDSAYKAGATGTVGYVGRPEDKVYE